VVVLLSTRVLLISTSSFRRPSIVPSCSEPSSRPRIVPFRAPSPPVAHECQYPFGLVFLVFVLCRRRPSSVSFPSSSSFLVCFLVFVVVVVSRALYRRRRLSPWFSVCSPRVFDSVALFPSSLFCLAANHFGSADPLTQRVAVPCFFRLGPHLDLPEFRALQRVKEETLPDPHRPA
jgi:hypothetical protein